MADTPQTQSTKKIDKDVVRNYPMDKILPAEFERVRKIPTENKGEAAQILRSLDLLLDYIDYSGDHGARWGLAEFTTKKQFEDARHKTNEWEHRMPQVGSFMNRKQVEELQELVINDISGIHISAFLEFMRCSQGLATSDTGNGKSGRVYFNTGMYFGRKGITWGHYPSASLSEHAVDRRIDAVAAEEWRALQRSKNASATATLPQPPQTLPSPLHFP